MTNDPIDPTPPQSPSESHPVWLPGMPPQSSEAPLSSPSAPVPPVPPVGGTPKMGRRGFPLVAWAAIIVVCMFMVGLPMIMPDEAMGEGDEIGLLMMRIQSQYMVGANVTTPGNSEIFLTQANDTLNLGTLPQRQRFVTLAAELGGPDRAADAVDDLDALIEQHRDTPDLELTPEMERTQDILRMLYSGDVLDTTTALARAEALSPDDRTHLTDDLGWFGRLALSPDGADTRSRSDVLAPARTVFITFIGAAFAGAAAAFFGFVGLVVLLVMALTGRLRSRLGQGAGHHAIYAETFAIWLIAFIGLQVPAGLVGMVFPNSALALVACAFFVSLIVLAWPVISGVPWAQVRRDIGWTRGSGVVVETTVGVGGYLMTLPLLGIGVVLTLVLLLIQGVMAGGSVGPFDPAGGPAHPIILEVGGAALWPKIQLFLVASVAAPIVEETMFRGVLYRHLRDATGSMGTALSAILSGTISGFVFAAIHPQGWVAIPALMGLAYGFVLVREWRGTVWPAMVVHGISNGIVMSLLTFVLSV